jgi:hypothetical protein
LCRKKDCKDRNWGGVTKSGIQKKSGIGTVLTFWEKQGQLSPENQGVGSEKFEDLKLEDLKRQADPEVRIQPDDRHQNQQSLRRSDALNA